MTKGILPNKTVNYDTEIKVYQFERTNKKRSVQAEEQV